MRSHGVPNFPDPSPTAHGVSVNIHGIPGIDLSSPSYKAAESTCSKLLPKGGPGGGSASASEQAAMLAISKCMRAHGVSGFPDPTTKAPSDPTAYSAVWGTSGEFIAVPSTIDINSPAFKRAAAACHFGPHSGH